MPRIAIAQFHQETGTFNPEITTKADFATHRLELSPTSEPIIAPGSELDGALQVFRSDDEYETVTLFQAWGGIGGRVEDGFAGEIERLLADGLRDLGPFDGCLLLLHGACASVSEDDLDGALVETAARVLLGVPLAVALDHHANVTMRLMTSATLVVGHRTEPHKPFETAALTAGLLKRHLDHEVKPCVAWAKVPMITPQDRFETHEGPMAEVFELARSLETGPILSVSPFPMQPWLDVLEGGWAVAVVADGDYEAATSSARAVADAMWNRRHQFWDTPSLSESDAVDRALAFDGLGVICDMGDGVFAGAAGDSPRLIASLIAKSAAAGATVRDREAVRLAWLAGVGAQIAVELGGEIDSAHAGYVSVDATVVALDDGPVGVRGLFGLEEIDEGRTALLRVGGVFIHVTEFAGCGGCHPGAFERYGMDIGDLSAVVMKGSAHYHTYDRWMAGRVRANTPGLTQSNLRLFQWNRIPRPIFGLDDIPEWEASPVENGPGSTSPAIFYDNSAGWSGS